MSRRTQGRLGLYYLVLRGTEGRMFYGDEDYPSFIRVLDPVLAETRYRLHAFCLLPAQAHLAVQMSEVALADFAQRVGVRHGHWLQQKYGRVAGAVELAAPPRLIDQDEQSRELIRRIHLLPLKRGLDPEEYIWSGHRTYLARARIACLETRTGLRLFAGNLAVARAQYEKFIQEGIELARASHPGRPKADSAAGIRSLHDLLARIAKLGGRTAEDILSGSRQRPVSLLRAVLAWHATRLQIATLGEVARYLRRDPSSVYATITRYSALYPALFREPGNLDALAAVRDASGNDHSS